MNSPTRFIVPTAALALSCLLVGCGANGISSAAAPVIASPSIAGNWNVVASSAPGSLSQIASVGGGLTVSATGSVSGVLHTIPVTGQTATALCVSPKNNIPVSGTYSANGTLTLTSSSFNGNVLTVSGTYVAATSTTHAVLNNATFNITGSCGVATQKAAVEQFSSINGTYTGSFTTDEGDLPVTSTLTQTTMPDSDGNYQLQGTATFTTPADMCISSGVVTDSTVNGSDLSATYTDPNSGATVQAIGYFDDAATTLTIVQWTLTGTGYCQANGTGVLNHQAATPSKR